MALAMAAFSLQSCEDVPMPYDMPTSQNGGSGESTEATGTGTADDPYNVAAANKLCAGLDKSSTSATYLSDEVYVKGIISSITDTELSSYGNITFYISDDGTETSQLEVYRCLSFNGAKFTSLSDIKIGDEVILKGQLQNWLGTYEFTSGAQLVSLNGQSQGGSDTPAAEATGSGTQADPYNVSGVLKYTNSLAADTNSESQIYFTGIICDEPSVDTGNYGNATFSISDDGTASNSFSIYRCYGLGNEKFTTVNIKKGDKVVICGNVVNYKGNTPETVSGKAYIVSINGNSEGGSGSTTPSGTAKGSGTEADPWNVAGIINYTSGLTADVNSTEEVYFTGTVQSFKSGEEPGNSYGNATFYIKDESTSETFYCFRLYGPNNEKFTSADQLQVGDKVLVKSLVVNYKGNTPETVSGKGYVVKIEKGSGSGSSEQGGSSASGNSITFSEMGYSNAQEFNGQSITVGDAQLTFSVGSGSVTPKYYTTGNAMRLYGGGTLTISSNKSIASVEFKYADTSTYCPTADGTTVSTGSYDFDSHIWTINGTSATITRTATTGQWRIVSITINYASAAKKYVRRRK